MDTFRRSVIVLLVAVAGLGMLPMAQARPTVKPDTPGVFRQGVFYLRMANTSGVADTAFPFGAPTDIPLAGDWEGDGVDTSTLR